MVGVRNYSLVCFFAFVVQAIAASGNGLAAIASTTTVTKSTTTTSVTKTGTIYTTAKGSNVAHYTDCSNDASPHKVFNCAGVCVKTSDHAAKQCRPIGYSGHYSKKCGGAQQQCNTGLTSNDCDYPDKTSLENQPTSPSIVTYCPKCGEGYMFSRNSDACVLPEFYQIDQDLISLYRLDAFASVDVEQSTAWLYDECDPSFQPGGTSGAKEEFSRICKINHCSALVQHYDADLKFVANKTFSEAKPFNWGKMPRDMQFSEMSKLFWSNFNDQMEGAYGAGTGCGSMSSTDVKPSTGNGASDSSSTTWQEFVTEEVGQTTPQLTFCSCAKYYVAPYVKQHFDNNVPYAPPKYNSKLFGAGSKESDIHQTKKTVHITFTAISGAGCGLLAVCCLSEMFMRKKVVQDYSGSLSLFY